MSTVSVYNRSLLLDMVTSDTEYQHDLSTNSALSNTSMSKKGSRRVPRSFQSRSIHKKDRKKTRKPGPPFLERLTTIAAINIASSLYMLIC